MYYSKFRNTKVETEFGTFDSKKELRRYMVLLDMQRNGEIQDLKRQVPYELIPSQRIGGKVVERAVKYIADFTYYKDGDFVVEDTKGMKTPEYVIKRKMMLYFKGIRIKEV